LSIDYLKSLMKKETSSLSLSCLKFWLNISKTQIKSKVLHIYTRFSIRKITILTFLNALRIEKNSMKTFLTT